MAIQSCSTEAFSSQAQNTQITQLIPLLPRVLEDQSKPGVSARNLYTFLGLSPTQYARWATKNILKNPYAIEHTDWETIRHDVENSILGGDKGRPSNDYALSVDFAKRLSMMARSAKGEEARQYFLDCEKAAQGNTPLPTLHDPAYQMLMQAVIDLDTTRHHVAQIETRQHAQALEMIENQRQTIEALQLSQSAHTKADLALEDAHHMTVEEWVMKNGLVHQFPPPSYQRIAAWLGHFCQQCGVAVYKAPVMGKAWDEENSYPLQAFAAFWRSELKRPTQIALVKNDI